MISFHKSLGLFFGLSLFLFYAATTKVFAGPYENEVVRSVLLRVEQIALRFPDLDSLGRNTLGQAVVILDLKEEAVPELLKACSDPKKNWKTRYWAVDLLGYVGNSGALSALTGIVKNKNEIKTIRLQALGAIREIAKRSKSNPGLSSALAASR